MDSMLTTASSLLLRKLTWPASNSPTTNTTFCCRTCLPSAPGNEVAPVCPTAAFSTASSGSSGPAPPGATCPNATAPGRLFTTAFPAGAGRASSPACWKSSWPMREASISSISTSPLSTELSSGHTKPPRARGKKIGQTPEQSREEQALGISRGGLSTKIHILVEGNGLPLSFSVTPGQAGEATQVDKVLGQVNVGGKRGPRKKRLRVVAGDKGYDGKKTLDRFRAAGTRPLVPQRLGPDGKYPDPDRPFDKELYRRRNVVERRNGHLKEKRRIATRYEKLAVNFVAMIQFAFVLTFLKIVFSDRA